MYDVGLITARHHKGLLLQRITIVKVSLGIGVWVRVVISKNSFSHPFASWSCLQWQTFILVDRNCWFVGEALCIL